QSYLLLGLLFLIFIAISRKIADYHIAFEYMPVTGLILLVAIIYNDLKLSFVISVLAACFSGIIANNSLPMCLIFLITGIITALLARKVRTRIRVLVAGICAGIVQALLFWLTYGESNPSSILPNLLNGSMCAIAVTGVLPLLENLFGIVTNISLLELADFNHPLLKKMVIETPGTHLHSLIVGNLAEAAAESIGANSLLARIGAYYHDIGKLSNPEYFVENQKASSKHLHLSPSMSKMVIMNHIKEGMDLAKKYRLKPAIIDFILQHHGTSLVYYFYRKALEEGEGLEAIHEEGFRYPGPRPASKETAIVLLADSVEAACRVLTDPQPAKIEEVVHKVINNKFIDGQLDDCELTLKDLENIAKVFIHILS
ncbi:MAG: HDIG domain-containing metalloprotein, partial [Bacteroidota bacterium]